MHKIFIQIYIMFNKINSLGNHQTYNYDINNHPFIKFFKELFDTENLDELHLKYKSTRQRVILYYLNFV